MDDRCPDVSKPIHIEGIGCRDRNPVWYCDNSHFNRSKRRYFRDGCKICARADSIAFLITYLLILIEYGAKYAAGYIVDDKGVTNYTLPKQAKRSRILNGILVVTGVISGRPSAAAAGLIAQSKQIMEIKWKNIRKVSYDPKRSTILIRGGLTEKIAVFCLDENYDRVEALIKARSGM